jgi:predicted MFS family arabinose efflux permease
LAGIFPAAYGLAARTTPNDRRGSANGVVFMCLAMAHAVGSLIGGEVLNRLGFRPLLATIAGTSFLLFLTTLRSMIATRRNVARRSLT